MQQHLCSVCSLLPRRLDFFDFFVSWKGKLPKQKGGLLQDSWIHAVRLAGQCDGWTRVVRGVRSIQCLHQPHLEEVNWVSGYSHIPQGV